MGMKMIDCPLCGSTHYKNIFTDYGYDKHSYPIVQCHECGFSFINPQPGQAELNKIYSTYYGAGGETEKTEGALQFRKNVFFDVGKLIRPYMRGEAKLLDVGCGNGEFLIEIQNEGWKGSGVEVSRPAVEF